MKIEIIGTESLGVRGMCCFVETGKRKILIDPGIALGYFRYGLLPHPYQAAVGNMVAKKIIERWSIATDIVFSHFHGDHVPLQDANPYQLDLRKLTGINKNIRIWTKMLSHLSPLEKRRADSISSVLSQELIEAEGRKESPLTFSEQVLHGDGDNNPVTVMMTKIEEDFIFVHASDIQLFSTSTIMSIMEWKPDVVFVDGPALYLSDKIGQELIDKARDNAVKLSRKTGILIIDHHLMRSSQGEIWMEGLKSSVESKIICGADFMGEPRRMLEARRSSLYEQMPVAKNWHQRYARGKASPDHYLKLARKIYQ
ncbi:MAG: MBL fold metallo-hydrolase [Actinomycetota bacterium]